MELRKTYTLETGPESLDISVYAEARNQEYKKLLEKSVVDKEVTEKDFQTFFENNPSFVPGAWTPGSKSGHYPLHCALITQPKLQGLTTKIPDFMWIATHSSGWFPTLIEIERPSKKIFIKKGEISAEFTQAKHQLEQWKTWFNDPLNVQIFLETYQIPDYMRRERQMKLHMILIYGRRNDSQARSKELMSLTSDGMDLMSYDRLSCDTSLRDAITIKLNSDGKYKALSIPPTFQLRPGMADRLLKISGIGEAIDKTIDITDERKKFLKIRCSYWENWAKNGEKGIINNSDAE